MYIVVGLGNPEKDYKGTRHNAGFEVINKLAYDNDININKAKFRAHIGEGVIKGKKVILVKPQTFMNLSGESVREVLNYYKLMPKDLIVAYDDIDLDLGNIRIREKGSAGTHNGMKNIVYQIESDEFTRVRVGVGNKPQNYNLADYVLSHFSKDEKDKIIKSYTEAADAVEIIINSGPKEAMNKYNSKN